MPVSIEALMHNLAAAAASGSQVQKAGRGLSTARELCLSRPGFGLDDFGR